MMWKHGLVPQPGVEGDFGSLLWEERFAAGCWGVVSTVDASELLSYDLDQYLPQHWSDESWSCPETGGYSGHVQPC